MDLPFLRSMRGFNLMQAMRLLSVPLSCGK